MSSITQCFFLDFKNILVDEIALDGLQGIGIKMLWDRLEKRFNSNVTPKMKEIYWKFIIGTDSISIYHVAEPPPRIKILDRFSIVDEATGYIVDPIDHLDGPYEWCPVENEYGSCSNYNTRALILKHNIQIMKYEEVESYYGDQLVLVASLEERWHALAPHLPFSCLNQLTPIHYGLLELIGKARENGQMTIGKSNLNKIVKEPKLLFYNRSSLQKLDLVKVQFTTQMVLNKAMKCILLRLKRFHQHILGSLPKIGRIANIVSHLLDKPDHSEMNEIMVKKGFMTSQQSKRLQKAMNVFTFDEREVKLEKNTKSGKQKVIVKKKFISLPQKSDESSTDEEVEELTLKCQYKVGVSIMRQAYERFLEAGLKGLTQIEVAQILGVEFYTSRAICRAFKKKNLVREFLEDKGRQRTTRYIAVATTEEIDKEYATEKNKLLEHINRTNNEQNDAICSKEDKSDSDNDIPIKKLKLEKDTKINTEERIDTDHNIIELQVLEGHEHVKESLLNAKKNLTLRQLKYANGILKVVKDQRFIIGFQTLSMLASKEIGEPPMDTKALKLFVQKMMIDKQLKVLKCIRPKRFSFFICDPQIKPTDDIIKKKYNEMCKKSIVTKKVKKPKAEVAKPLSQLIYQKYIKLQILHEFIIRFVYFSENKISTSFLTGFTSLLTIIPEMTVEFALSNINNIDTSDLAEIILDEHSKSSKIQDTPEHLRDVFLQSKSLQNSVKATLKVLSAVGLIQLVHPTQKSSEKEGTVNTYVFYVNRHAKIINTSGKWPRPADESSLEKIFYFQTFEDVQKYWLDVINISSNTIINVEKRECHKLTHPLRNETEVKLFDNGERLGDGLGPCGFDSTLFLDIPRIWRKLIFKNTKIPLPQSNKSMVKKIVKKKLKKPKITLKKEKIVDKLDIPEKKRRGKRPDASLVKWSHFEDKILMLCKAAITIMSPVSQPGLLKVRNIAAKDILSTIDPKKTGSCCRKRALMLESNSVLTYEKDCIINELRRRRHLVKKYEGLLRTLRLRHCGYISRYINESRLPMLELIWLGLQIERTKPYNQRVPCIAINFDDFNKKYRITPTSANQSCNVYRTPITSEPENAALKEGIILSIMLSVKKPITKETAHKIYTIFKEYPETTLRNAVEQLRKAGAIAAQKITINLNKAHFDDIVESSYKMSAIYRRKWRNILESDFYNNVANMLNNKLPEKGLKGTCELNCFLCEMNSCDLLDFNSDTIPVVTGSAGSIIQEEQMNMIDMENKFKLKSGLIAWKAKCNVKVFSELYQHIEFKRILDNILQDAVLIFPDAYDYIQDEIILYLEEKNKKGSTFSDMQNHFGMDRKVLCEKLMNLEAKKIIKRVGYYENLIVLTKYAIPLALKIDTNFYMIPTPWLTLEATIHLDIFLKWTSVIMNKIFESPGCSIDFLSNNFEFITARGVQDICTFLEKCECVTLSCIEKKSVDLFTEDDDVFELTEYVPYDSPDNILVFPVKNSLTKYSYIRTQLLDETVTSD